MIRRTFKADDMEARFERYGYTIIRRFIDTPSIEALKLLYEKNKIDSDRSFYVSHWIEGGNFKKVIDEGIQQILYPFAKHYLLDYVPVFAALSVKHSKPDSAMHLHQDWAHVDEKRFRSVNVWVAVDETTPDNGAICLLKGSHRLFDDVRGVSTPDTFRYIGEEALQPYLTGIYLQPGDAVVWDHRVIHGSYTNRSGQLRLGAVINMRPADSEFVLYYMSPQKKSETIEVYSPTPDFFVSYDSVNHPEDVEKQKLMFSYPYHDIHITQEKLDRFLQTEFPGEFPHIEKPQKWNKWFNLLAQ